MNQTANARFAVKNWDENAYSEGQDLPKLTRASVTKTFTGDIEGEGHVEYLMMYRSDGSATFVGLERVIGRIGAKTGTFVLQRIRHAFRVRATAPLHVRARRLEAERGLVPDAEDVVARSDRDWAARIRHLYDVALDDPLQYDLVRNTARVDIPTAVATIRTSLAAERFHATSASLAEVRDRCMTARVHAALLTNSRTRELGLFFSCRDDQVSLSGRVARDDQRRVAEEVVGRLPGVTRVLSEIVVILPPPTPPGP